MGGVMIEKIRKAVSAFDGWTVEENVGDDWYPFSLFYQGEKWYSVGKLGVYHHHDGRRPAESIIAQISMYIIKESTDD